MRAGQIRIWAALVVRTDLGPVLLLGADQVGARVTLLVGADLGLTPRLGRA
jgi:hypothetical protein